MAVGGNNGLNFGGSFDISEIVKNQQKVIQGFNDIKKAAEASGQGGGRGSSSSTQQDTQAISGYRQAQLQMQESLRNSRLETERLKQEQIALRTSIEQNRLAQQNAITAIDQHRVAEQQLRNELTQGRITQQQYDQQLVQSRVALTQQNTALAASRTSAQNARTELARLTLEQRQLAIAAREARNAQRAVAGSYAEAQQRLRELGVQIRSAEGGFLNMGRSQRAAIAEYRALNSQLTEFDRRMGNNQRNVGNYAKALSGLTSFVAPYLSAMAALSAVNKVIKNNAEVADALSDVRRTAELTESEANNLLETFKKFDTRTSLKGLIEIAGIGGQIGIAKDDIEGFTRSIDKLSIVLANEIPGGANAVATALGKINGVFDVQKREGTSVEQSFNKTGAAILGLGQAGLATGDFLVDFTQRVSGAAKQADISLPTILAYGSVLEEAGKSAEVAGSSLNRIIMSLSTNRKEFFTIAQLGDANLTMKEFTRVINTDVNAALQLFFKGLNSGNPSQTAFADRLKTIPKLAGETRSSIIALAQSQEKLSEKIKISNKDYEDTNKITDQAALKIDNLAGSLDKLGKVFENATTSGRTAGFFKGVVDGLTNAIDKFNNLVNSKSWKEFWFRFTNENQTGKDVINMIETFGEVSKKNKDNFKFITDQQGYLNEDKLQKLGMDNFNKYLSKVKQTYDKALEAYTSYAAGVESGRIKEEGDTVEQYKYQSNIAKEYYERLAATQKRLGFDKGKPAIVKSDESGIDEKPKGVKSTESALKAQRALQREIQDAIAESSRAQLSADDAEIQSVTDKYAKLKQKAAEFNQDQAKKDKERLAQGLKPGGFRADLGGLNAAESNKIQAIIDKQSNDRLKKKLEEQGKLYQQFEVYREKLGQEAAEKRFKGEFTTGESYAQKLEDMQTKLLSEITDPAKATEGQRQELAILKDQIDEYNAYRKDKQDQAYENARSAATTNAEILLGIDKQYQKNKEALGEGATADQLSVLSKGRDAQIRSQNEANAVALSGYDELMMNMEAMTKQKVIDELNIIKEGYAKQYSEGKLTAEQLSKLTKGINDQIDSLNGNNAFNKIIESVKRYKKVLEKFPKDSIEAKNAQKEMYGAIAEGAQAASEGVSILSDVFGKLGIGGEALQATLGSVTGMLDGFAGLAKGLKEKDPVAVIAGSIKVLTTVIDLFNTKDKKLEKKIKGYQDQLEALGVAYKQLDRDVANSVGESIYTDQASQVENLKKQQALLIQQRNAESGKKKADKKKIDEYNAAINEIPGKIQDINKAIAENLIQTNFKDLSNNLADALSEAFKTGEDRAKAFDDVFSNVIQNAVKNSLKLKILDPIIKKFTDDLTKYAQNNNNSILGFDFKQYEQGLKDAGNLFTGGLEESQKFLDSIGLGTSNIKAGEGVKGKLQRELTETTASEFLGVTRNIYEIQVKQSSIMSQSLDYAKSGVQQLELIQFNTAQMVIGLQEVVVNTKPSQTQRDLGI